MSPTPLKLIRLLYLMGLHIYSINIILYICIWTQSFWFSRYCKLAANFCKVKTYHAIFSVDVCGGWERSGVKKLWRINNVREIFSFFIFIRSFVYRRFIVRLFHDGKWMSLHKLVWFMCQGSETSERRQTVVLQIRYGEDGYDSWCTSSCWCARFGWFSISHFLLLLSWQIRFRLCSKHSISTEHRYRSDSTSRRTGHACRTSESRAASDAIKEWNFTLLTIATLFFFCFCCLYVKLLVLAVYLMLTFYFDC